MSRCLRTTLVHVIADSVDVAMEADVPAAIAPDAEYRVRDIVQVGAQGSSMVAVYDRGLVAHWFVLVRLIGNVRRAVMTHTMGRRR